MPFHEDSINHCHADNDLPKSVVQEFYTFFFTAQIIRPMSFIQSFIVFVLTYCPYSSQNNIQLTHDI